jgi:hypothetical protein
LGTCREKGGSLEAGEAEDSGIEELRLVDIFVESSIEYKLHRSIDRFSVFSRTIQPRGLLCRAITVKFALAIAA